MPVVALVEAAGTSVATTTAIALAAAAPAGCETLVVECDPSGGDLAGWAGLADTPGWTTATSSGDRSWEALCSHLQQLPSGLSVLLAPSRARVARTVVRESATRFGTLLSSMDVIAFVDCGRVEEGAPSPWASSAQLTLVLVRQGSAPATVTRVDRAGELIERVRGTSGRTGVVVVGSHPYDPGQVADAVGAELFGTLADDAIGAGQIAGAWTIGRGAGRSALLRSARPVAEAVLRSLAAPVNPAEPVAEQSHEVAG